MRYSQQTLEILMAELYSRTSSVYTFRIRWKSPKSNKQEFHIIPPHGSDDGFHLYRVLKHRIRWYSDPFQAVDEFFRDYNIWLQQKWMQPQQVKSLAGPPGSKRLHSPKPGGDLPCQ